MIAWNAKYGYYDNTNTNFPASLSDIVVTDEGPFSILTSSPNTTPNFQYASPGEDIGVTSTPKFKTLGRSFLATGLQSLLGEDYFYCYLHPTSQIYNENDDLVHDFNMLTETLFTATNACPNLFNILLNPIIGAPGNGTTPPAIKKIGCCYIPSLKKVLIDSRIFNVLENGNLTPVFSGSQLFGPKLANTLQGNSGNSFFYIGLLYNPNYDGTPESFYLTDQYFLQIETSDRWYWDYCINKGINTDQIAFYKALFSNFVAPDYSPNDHPYDPIDPSGPTDPDEPPGSFDDDSDPIPDSSLPSLSSANTGFTRIYNPTLSQVQQLANYLWTDESVITTIWNHIKQYFEDPMQAIIGFNLVPVPVPDGGTEEFKLMYIGTGVNMTVAASQFVDVDCGTFQLLPYYGSALDYAPHTKVSCFLPFIGTVELNPDEIMNTTLQVKYRVDICSGSCVAKILVDSNCLYQYSGHCAIPIPFASADFSSYVSAAISVAKLAVGGAAAGIAGSAGAELAAVTQATTTTTSYNASGDISSVSTRESTQTSPASYQGITPRNISNTVGEVMGAKPAFQHSGSFSGNTGYLGIRRPFLIIERPNLCMPSSYRQMNGYPCMITMALSECKGFTQIQQMHFTGSSATNPEVDEILQFLKQGVIF